MSPFLRENGRTPVAYVSGANFLPWSFIGLPRKPSYSASFLHWISLLSYPHSITLYIFDEYLNSPWRRLPFEYPGSAGAGPRHLGKLCNLFMPQFPLQNGNDSSTYLIGELWGLKALSSTVGKPKNIICYYHVFLPPKLCCESPNPSNGPLRKNYWSNVGAWGLFHSWHLTLFPSDPERQQAWKLSRPDTGDPLKWSEEMLVVQLCLTLCDLMDWGSPGFSVHGIFQARILEWVAISFSTLPELKSSLHSLCDHGKLFNN